MKVKIKKEFYEKFRLYWAKQHECIVEYDEFDVNKEFIVLGICYHLSYYPSSSESDLYYLMKDVDWALLSSKYYYITDDSIPDGWSIKDGNSKYAELFFTFGDYDEELYSNFLENSYQYVDNAYEIELKRYYDLEVEDFFKNTTLSNLQKQDMIEYYKSQPTREQWDKDAEFLSEYVVKSD